MNIARTWRKGAVLLQTLVVAILMAYISVMIMSWVLQRYSLATRVYRKNVSMAHNSGYAMMQFAKWNTGTPSGTSGTLDGKTVTMTVGGATQMTVTTDPNQE